MKKLLLLISLLWLLAGCTIYYNIGMSEADFWKQNRGKGLRILEDGANRKVIAACDGYGNPQTFFYFRNGYLYQMDNGTPRPDIIIENH